MWREAPPDARAPERRQSDTKSPCSRANISFNRFVVSMFSFLERALRPGWSYASNCNASPSLGRAEDALAAPRLQLEFLP